MTQANNITTINVYLFISGVDISKLNQKCNYCIDTLDILNQWFIAN